jgi:hypothetical protein
MTRSAKLTMAQKADRHALYQNSVQCAESELDFVEETFLKLRHRRAVILREDFCGTANVACEWARRRRDNLAFGVDLDGEVLNWAREHNLGKLGAAARRRIHLVNHDVLTVRVKPADVVLAMNFSYWLFKERGTLRRYFRRVRDALVRDGIFFLDAYGGYDTFRVLRERTRYDRHTYVWHQAAYNPISGEATCHIDFTFPDGSALRKAFSYHWRVWTLPEIREVLSEAGFQRITVYWQGTDEETGEANGNFLPAEVGAADAGWIAYLTAEK